MAPSSSGLGRRAFIPKIAGSIPAGVTAIDLVIINSSFRSKRQAQCKHLRGVIPIPPTRWIFWWIFFYEVEIFNGSAYGV